MAIGDVYETAFYHRTVDGQNAVNVTHWRHEATVGSALGTQQIADEISEAWGATILAFLPSTTKYQGCKFRRVFPNPTNMIQSEAGAGDGSLITDPLPAHVTFLISRRSYTAPVYVRGRLYLPAPDEAQNSSLGAPEAAYRSAVKTAFDALLTFDLPLTIGADTVSVRNGIFRRNHSPVFYPTDFCLYRQKWTSQRRRRPITRPDISVF